jgi:hypothetical protein
MYRAVEIDMYGSVFFAYYSGILWPLLVSMRHLCPLSAPRLLGFLSPLNVNFLLSRHQAALFMAASPTSSCVGGVFPRRAIGRVVAATRYQLQCAIPPFIFCLILRAIERIVVAARSQPRCALTAPCLLSDAQG